MTSLAAIEDINSKSPLLILPNELLKFPNELLLEVASHLERFRDLNALLRTSRFFRMLFHTLLYRRAITANDTVRDGIVSWVLSEYRVASLTHLLDNGLSANHKFEEGEYLLHTVCRLRDNERSVPLARLLIERGADIEAKDATNSSTVLHAAVLDGNREIVALLLAHGADVDAPGPNGDASLLSVLRNRRTDLDVIPVLLAHGADACAHDDLRETPLHVLFDCFESDDLEFAKFLELTKLLLEHGADVNAINFCGRTPLHLISGYTGVDWNADIFMAEFLLENGADVNAISRDGRSPLQQAITNLALGTEYRDRLIALLISHGAEWRIPLQHAISNPSLSTEYKDRLVARLIAAGVDVSASNSANSATNTTN
jgi:ankyrin repeat protein